MKNAGGRPRGSGRVRKATEAALAAARTDDLGCTLAAMIAEGYPVPVPYSAIAERLSALTGVRLTRATVYDWLTDSRARLAEAEAAREDS